MFPPRQGPLHAASSCSALTPSWQDKSVPMSLATHLADVYLIELDKVLSDDAEPAPLLDLLAPFIQLLARTRNSTVHKRLLEIIFVPLLHALRPEDERLSSAPAFGNVVERATVDGKPVDPATLRAALLRALFHEAAQESTIESNRRRIYQLVREEDDDE